MKRLFALIAILGGLAAWTHALAQTPTTDLVSVDSSGIQGDESSFSPVISADGRFVAFHSLASNLTPEGNSGVFNVYLHDRETGITELISITTSGEASNSTSTAGQSVNADGRFVAFYSRATNLVPEPDANGSRTDIFVRDRGLGVTEFVSVNSAGVQSNGFSGDPSINGDGRFVAFRSDATNLAPGGDANGTRQDIFVRDRQTGVTELISVSSSGVQGNDSSWAPVISADGRFVAFYSTATNLVAGGDANGALADVFVRDRLMGTTELVSVSSSGEQGNASSFRPAISGDGMVVAFDSSADNLVPGDANSFDVFVHDRLTGVTELVSVDSSGQQANDVSAFPSLNADGRIVAFWSRATNLIAGGDANGRISDVFIHDRQTGATEVVTVNNSGIQANGSNDLRDPETLSADGRVITFMSSATNLVPGGDANGTSTDIFVRDRGVANQAPLANAGPDQRVTCTAVAGTAVMLDGSGSSDPDGDPLSYLWTGPFPEGGGSATGVHPTVTLGFGTSSITLVVDDGQLESAPDTVAVTVAAQVDGLLAPLSALVAEPDQPPEPQVAYQAGRTLPLKLRLSCGAQALTDLEVAPPEIVALTPVGEAPLDLDIVDLDAGSANDNGPLFRFSGTDGQWIYNLTTADLTAGSVYQLVIAMPDGLRYGWRFALR